MSECECEGPGFCLRYNRPMNEGMVQICRGEALTPERCEHWKAKWLKQRPTLAGDVIEKITKATGIAAVVNAVSKLFKKPCGCKGRQKRMNEAHLELRQNWCEKSKNLLSETEILVKSFRRQNLLLRFLESVKTFYPDMVVHVVDDSGEMTEEGFKAKGLPNVIWHEMPFDSGLPAGRNLAVRESSEKYVIICDDDFLFTKETDLGAMLVPLGELDICGGLIRYKGRAENWCGTLRIEGETLWMEKPNHVEEIIEGVPVFRTDITHNFFAAKREQLLAHPWDERYKITSEHLDSFLTWKLAGLKVGYTTRSLCNHIYPKDAKYQEFRERKYFEALDEKWGITERRTIASTKFREI